MKKICILTHSHLCRNPRVVKEANTLQKAGYSVTIQTLWTDRQLLNEDLKLIDLQRIRYTAGENVIPGESSTLKRAKSRLIRRLAKEITARTWFQSRRALGYGYNKNLRLAIKENADLYICHQEMPTVIGVELLKMGFRVAFDFEDWYSHDLLPDANRFRPVGLLNEFEIFALKNSHLTYTTSHILARELATHAGASLPQVLLNVFPEEERKNLDGQVKDRVDLSRISLHWFSQTTGPGRGLEELADAMNDIYDPFELHLRGNVTAKYKQDLLSRFHLKSGQDVYFQPLVSHKELLSRISEHDIGLALERNNPQSRNLTITNKIMQFLQGGLAVIASSTSGQEEVAKISGEAVRIIHSRNEITTAVRYWISDPVALTRAKKKAIKLGQDRFCWDREEPKLIDWINKIMN